jgi:hypothetical protein
MAPIAPQGDTVRREPWDRGRAGSDEGDLSREAERALRDRVELVLDFDALPPAGVGAARALVEHVLLDGGQLVLGPRVRDFQRAR